MEEVTESKNSNKNDEINLENEENTKMRDFSSNLDGYSGSKGEFGKDEANESYDKNIGSENIGEEDKSQSEQP